MKMLWKGALALPLALALGACNDSPVAPTAAPAATHAQPLLQQSTPKGTGIVLNSVTGLSLPVVSSVLGQLGTVNIDQAVITNFAIVENTVGQIVGLKASGVLQLTGGLLGTNVVTQNFTTTASVTSSGPGQCSLVSIDLGSIDINALNLASVDVPAATLTGQGSGAVGSLLCNLGNLLSGLTSGGTGSPGAAGVVTALNNQIG